MRFSYPPGLWLASLVVAALAGLVFAVLAVILMIAFFSGQAAVGLVFAMGCDLLFFLFGYVMVKTYSPSFELGPKEIIQYRGKKTAAFPYDSIVSIVHRTAGFPSLVIKTADAKMTVYKSIAGYPRLWKELSGRLPAALRPAPQNGEELRIPGSCKATYTACLMFIIPSLAFVVMGWVACFTQQGTIGTAIVMSLTLIPFSAALAGLMRTCPRYYVFGRDTILVKSLGGEKAYPVSGILKFACGQRFIKVNARAGSYYAHFVELEFGDGQKLNIDQKDTNYPMERLSDELTNLYRLEAIKTVEVLESRAKEAEKRPGKAGKTGAG